MKRWGERKTIIKPKHAVIVFACRGKLRFVGCLELKMMGFFLGFMRKWGEVVLGSFVASHDTLLYPTTPSSAAE